MWDTHRSKSIQNHRVHLRANTPHDKIPLIFRGNSRLLPPPTASALDSLLGPQGRGKKEKGVKVEEGYPVKMHAYAIRMLAELEDAQKEYDEWWSENGVGRMDGAPPRLTVAWPFHEGDD